MTASAELTWIPTERRTALVKESEIWVRMAEEVVKTVVVNDPATAAHAAEMIKKARDVYRAKEDERKTMTTPILASKAAVDAYFKPTTDAILKIKKHYEQSIAAYDYANEQARAAVLVQSAEEIAVGLVPTAPIPAPVHVEATSVRHRWEPEIVDPDLVPAEYCSPDLDKIRKAVWYADTHAPPRPIPGVKFSIRSVTVVR
jgi:hypothetical protein